MRHVTEHLHRGALLALLVVTASCGGAASDAQTTVASTAATGTEARTELAGVAFDVRRDPG